MDRPPRCSSGTRRPQCTAHELTLQVLPHTCTGILFVYQSDRYAESVHQSLHINCQVIVYGIRHVYNRSRWTHVFRSQMCQYIEFPSGHKEFP